MFFSKCALTSGWHRTLTGAQSVERVFLQDSHVVAHTGPHIHRCGVRSADLLGVVATIVLRCIPVTRYAHSRICPDAFVESIGGYVSDQFLSIEQGDACHSRTCTSTVALTLSCASNSSTNSALRCTRETGGGGCTVVPCPMHTVRPWATLCSGCSILIISAGLSQRRCKWQCQTLRTL